MKIPTALALAALLMTLPGARGVSWGQSLYGPGGLLLYPTATFPARGELTSAILAIPQENARLGGRRTWVSTTLDYGLTDRWEIALTHVKVNPGRPPLDEGSTGGSAKYQLVAGVPGGRPDVAAGAGFLAGGDAETQVGFLALRFAPERRPGDHPFYLHMGLLYADQMSGIRREDLVPYGGVEAGVTSNLRFFAEARAALDSATEGIPGTRPARAVGLVWRPVKGVKLVLALANDGLGSGYRLSAGAGYNIGIRRPR